MIVLPSVSSGVISSSFFDPKKISGLALWLKADTGVTLGISQIIISGFTGIYAGANGTYNYDYEENWWYQSGGSYYINSGGELRDDNDQTLIATNNNNFQGAWSPSNYFSTITLSNAGEDVDQGVVVVNGVYTRSDTGGPFASFTASGGRSIDWDPNDGDFWETSGGWYRNYGPSLNVGDWQPEAGEEPVPTAVNSTSTRNVGSPTSITVIDLVTSWADQSGNDNNFNGTAEFLTNTLNGKPVINFNGIDTFLTGPAGLLSGFSALSFIAVWNVGSEQSNAGIFGSSNYSNLEVIADGDVAVRIRNNNYSATFINVAGLTNLDEFALSYFDASNLTGSVFKNGEEATVAYISEIILTDAGTSSSNGTYTRGSSGTASFSGPDGNEIYWDGAWYLYDANLEDISYYNEEFDFSSGWQLNYGEADAPTSAYTTTTGSIGNQSAVQMPLATNITYELGRYAYPDYQTLYASFQLAELIIYNSKLTTPQRQQVEAYLKSKYAIY